MTEPAAQIAYDEMEQANADLREAAVELHTLRAASDYDAVGLEDAENWLTRKGLAYAKAQENYLAVLNSLGDGAH